MTLTPAPLALAAETATLPALLWRRAALTPTAPALWSLVDGQWLATDWRQYRDSAARIAASVRGLGLAPGDCVGILAPSSQRWEYAQMGILAARGTVVGLDPHDRPDSLNAIAQQCALTGLVVADAAWLQRFDRDIRDRLRFVIAMKADDTPGVIAFDRMLAETPENAATMPDTRPEDAATIVFTSGTTGTPKGIRYTNAQFIAAVTAILDAFPHIGADYRLACWLPLSNLFQRMIDCCAIAVGAQTFFVEDPRAIMQHIRTIAPHLFIGVPRFYEKLHAGMMDKIAAAPTWQRALVHWALRQGDLYARTLRAGQVPSWSLRARHALADRFVLRRLRAVLGPNLRFMVSGSAPMPRWLLERFHAMGLLVLEAYGMSENIVPVAMNRLDAYRFGTVGRPLRGNEIRLGEDGELWVRGPGVFSGYIGETTTEARFDADGYLASGDYATIDDHGFITLTGRKSEIFKTSTGRRIAPAGIEAVLNQLPYVEHSVVFGAGRPFPVAILVVSSDAWKKRAENNDPAHLCRTLRQDLAPGLATLTDYRRPAGAIVTTRLFSIERGELTSNLKLRRKQIETGWREPLDALYASLQNHAPATWMQWADESVLLCPLSNEC